MTAPLILLSKPQMQENIGAVARAMNNFALTDLRLISPREGKPDTKAYAMASGADSILDKAVIYDNFQESIKDVQFLLATTARTRDMAKPAFTPRDGVQMIHEKQKQGIKCGLLFGGERSGLDNQEIIYADALIHIPANPDFSSLNLAQAVLLVGYEYFTHSQENAHTQTDETDKRQKFKHTPATKAELDYFLKHLENLLDDTHFFYPADKKPSMVQIIRNLFTRSHMNAQEVRTLHGILKALMGKYLNK